MSEIRIGSGIDIHRTATDRRCILGGVEVPSEFGLLGHSDADVLLHAIIDAVLGALGWGDIGNWFPDTDPTFKDADSKALFTHVWERARGEGWSLGNCDSTILCERPKIAPHVASIRSSIAGLFDAGVERVNVKATTGEKLGCLGREEGIMATASVLLTRHS